MKSFPNEPHLIPGGQDPLSSGSKQVSTGAEGQEAYAGQLSCLMASDGRILKAASAFCLKFGITGTCVGKNILDYISPEERGLLTRKLLLAHHHQKSYFIELQPSVSASSEAVKMQLIPKENALYLEEIRQIPISAPSQQALQEGFSPALLPAFVKPDPDHAFVAECIPLPVLLYNKDHELQFANNHFLTFAAYPDNEVLLGLSEEELFPQQGAILLSLRSRVIEGAEKTVSSQLALRTYTGGQCWVSYTFSKVPAQELYMAVLLDISQLKEQELAMQNRQEEMGMFMDWAFHDLKGPLNSLMALYALVEHEYGKDKQVMEYFSHYHQGITRLHKTLNDLLLLSRIQKAEPCYKPLCLHTMVDECLQSFKNLPSFYKIRFVNEIKIKDPILTEENLLRTIVQNLLENAIKYSAETDPEVCVAAYHVEQGFCLEIRDNGIGIPQELHQKVFDRFFRATTKASGSGLGLFLLRKAVYKLNGQVNLHSAEGQGTTFTVFIPYRP